MSCVAQRPHSSGLSPSRPWLKPVLSAADYLALLNQRLRAHPMYLEGMAFPVASGEGGVEADADSDAEDETLPLVILVLDTRWDHFGVFASVIDEVRQSYELAPALLDANPAAPAVQLRPRTMACTTSAGASE